MTIRRVPVVAAALLDSQRRVLLTQRPEGSHLAGTWEFPGGKREPEEGDRDALQRELSEELGVAADIGPLVAELEHRYDDFVVHLRLFAGVIRSGAPRALEVADLRWVEMDRIRELEMPPADGPLIEALDRFIRSGRDPRGDPAPTGAPGAGGADTLR